MKTPKSILFAGLIALSTSGSTGAAPPNVPSDSEPIQHIQAYEIRARADATPVDDSRYAVRLGQRRFVPEGGMEPSFGKRLKQALRLGENPHVYLQLTRQLGAVERDQLAKEGLVLVSYVGSYTWRASVTDPRVMPYLSNPKKRRVTPLRLVRWVGEILPEDRISPRLAQEAMDAPDTALRYVIIQFHEDLPLAEAAVLVENAGGEDIEEIRTLNSLQAKGTSTMIRRLMGLDAVKWIGKPPPAGKDDNDGMRAAMDVDDIQEAPYNLDGSGARIGQWELGYADPRHEDLNGRITLYDGSIGDPQTIAKIRDHATHVAGTMVGDGTLSEGEGGTPNQWRGVAPNAEAISFARPILADGETTDLAALAEQFTAAIAPPYFIALANHSWRMGHYHEGDTYDIAAQLYDYVVRPAIGSGIPLITSAGNEGPEVTNDCSEGWTTLSTPNAAKNTIQVGSIPSDMPYVTWYPSRGPTLDGRLKPDVVAVGHEVIGDGGVNSAVPVDSSDYPYGVKEGTSMATAATSGVVALLLEDWWDSHSRGPLPSTVKAILVHTADDVTHLQACRRDYFGPDYFSGYGRVNAHAAIVAIRAAGRVREGVIESVDDEDIYKIEASSQPLKVTLAWDDKPADPAVEEQAVENDERANLLVNDLDLLLISPEGDAFHPPWELDPDDPEQPAVANSYADESTANGHRDSVNVVEQVFVEDPAPGVWTIKVKAHDLPWPRPQQPYSLVANGQIARPVAPPPPMSIPSGYDILDDPLFLMDCGLCKGCYGRLCDPRVNPEFDLFLVFEPDPEPAAVSFRYSELGLKDEERPLLAAAPLDGWSDQKVFAASAPHADSTAPDAGAVLFFDRWGKTVARVDGIARGEQLGIDMDVSGNEVVVASTRRIVRIDRGQATFDMDLEKSTAARRGIQVAFTQDIDGDRKPEILLGLPYADAGKLTQAGQIRVIGSRRASVVDVIYGQKADQHLGAALHSIKLQ